MKLSCCSLRRNSRTRKIVFTTIPAMISAKKTMPKNSSTPSRQFEDDPADVQGNRQRYQADAQAEEEDDGSAAARDAHGKVSPILPRSRLWVIGPQRRRYLWRQ